MSTNQPHFLFHSKSIQLLLRISAFRTWVRLDQLPLVGFELWAEPGAACWRPARSREAALQNQRSDLLHSFAGF